MKVTDEWLYEKMPIVDEAIIQKLEAADTERKVYVCRKTVEENHTENCGSSGCDACGSTHRHDECGGLPGTVFSYNKNGAGW